MTKPSKFKRQQKVYFSTDYRAGRASGGQVHPKTSTIRPRVHPMQSGPSQWSRFNVTRIRTTLSFGPSTRVTAQATNPSDYRAWRKRGRLTGPRRQGSRKERSAKGCEEKRGKERVTRRGRESSVLFARDGRVAIATGGCLLLRPAVVGWYRAVYGRKGCGTRGGRGRYSGRGWRAGGGGQGESKGLGNAVEGIEGRKDMREREREKCGIEGNASVQRGSGGRPHEAEKHTLHQTYPFLHPPPVASSRW